jgi:hypothetical protein
VFNVSISAISWREQILLFTDTYKTLKATDTSCLEPPTIVPEVSPDENEAPPTYEEAVEDSQHSFSETDISERRPV